MSSLSDYFIKNGFDKRTSILLLNAFSERKYLKKGDFLIKEGAICQELAFIETGLIRHFFYGVKEEITRWVSLEDNFCTSLASFINQTPSVESLQAISDTHLLCISKDRWKYLYTNHELVRNFWTSNIEYLYTGMEERLYSLLALPASERYQLMLRNYPAFNLVVPDKYLASTLSTFWKPVPANYSVKRALEVESLFPMFFTGGFHGGLGYRYEKFRVRVSVINGGRYDAEPAGVSNSKNDFKRYYKTSPGIFLGYNIWKNLDVYTFFEYHTYQIEQKSTGAKNDMKSVDYGGGIGYQFFIGRIFYIQPAFHLYLRKAQQTSFGAETYHIPKADIAPVIRIGVRYWKKY
jgi:hypothetical protein